MNNLPRIAAVAGAAALLVALAGCSTGTAVSAVSSPAASPSHTAAVIPAPVPTAVAVVAPPSPCAGTTAGVKEIYVSISAQHLWACTGPTLVTQSAVTTGASALTNVHDATPVGLFHITGKTRNTVLAGHDVNGAWHDAVTYWLPFSGGVGFHDSPWQTFPLGSPLYTSQGSHGCVHVALNSLATMFAWASVGTAVSVRA